MHEDSKHWFRLGAGTNFDSLTRTPTAPEVVSLALKQTQSRLPLRILGQATDGSLAIAEEERAHTHILGLPGKGKSKLLELLIRGDIDNLVAGKSKAGLCLIDSSDFGNTYYKILNYCVQVGYEKVCLIDPNDLFDKSFGKVPTLNPIHYGAPADVVTGSVMEIIRILWDSDNFAQTARIQEYLESLIEILHETGGTLFDAKYFTNRATNELYQRKRETILSQVRYPQFSDAATSIQEAFSYNPHLFASEFKSTVRRLRPLFSKTLQLMIASNRAPINFQKLIAEGWVILCNLDPRIWDVPQQKFLGTLIISEIINASYRLIAAGRNVPYYLYIDEVGRYATRTLADVMNYKRTSRIQLVMAHQDFSQIKHPEVLAAVRNAPIKVLFYVERDDRERVVRQMFGGDIPIPNIVWEVGKLKTREAYIRVGTQNPRKTEIKNLPDPDVSPSEVTAFKRRVYEHEWYRTRREIFDEINARFTESPTIHERPGGHGGPPKSNLGGPVGRTNNDGQATGASSSVRQGRKPRKTYFDKKVRKDT